MGELVWWQLLLHSQNEKSFIYWDFNFNDKKLFLWYLILFLSKVCKDNYFYLLSLPLTNSSGPIFLDFYPSFWCFSFTVSVFSEYLLILGVFSSVFVNPSLLAYCVFNSLSLMAVEMEQCLCRNNVPAICLLNVGNPCPFWWSVVLLGIPLLWPVQTWC